ncbi:hypothetical protein [Parageobacillus toebii]|jgi:hypothetical protein|uniref:hypothetical protein n=1 Tax=Parageobacillus toebii TaxID=153151 RepID=UPI0019677749|nr:hypothetical protein [Parageobacillus toebii]QSB48788.1 hypothetical protein JTI59_17265 [Parageobacillus toebii]
MKFYEVHYPYYALLKAETKEEALKLYIDAVCDDDGSLSQELKEVERDYALAMYSRAKTEDGKDIPIPVILEDFQDDESKVLLIDSTLL